MAAVQPLEFRWGIISTGWIASVFVKDLLIDPKTRGVNDIIHKVSSVGSRSVEKAQEFIDKFAAGDKGIKAFGSYEEVYNDPDVDCIYIGTPHTFHYTNTLAALQANKHVLVEKPSTCNSAELKHLLGIAKEKKLFFMEALWTRFQPLVKQLKQIAEDKWDAPFEQGGLGKPVVLHADLSGDFDVENIPKTHRILDPCLGGGALLDLGPYPMIWAILALYEHPSNASNAPSQISGSMLKTSLTGVDSSTSFTLNFSDTLEAQAILSCSITLPSPTPAATIRYRNGSILIPPPIYCPKSFTVQWFDKPGSGKIAKQETFEVKPDERERGGGIGGWCWQADEVARCVRDGKLESGEWGWEKSLLCMRVFDEVRKQGGYEFPQGVEKV